MSESRRSLNQILIEAAQNINRAAIEAAKVVAAAIRNINELWARGHDPDSFFLRFSRFVLGYGFGSSYDD